MELLVPVFETGWDSRCFRIKWINMEEGIPQGGNLSPLLSNIMPMCHAEHYGLDRA